MESVKKTKKLTKASPLLLLVVVALVIIGVGATIRFILIKPAEVTVNMVPNEYIIEFYTETGGVGLIETITFAGERMENDPSQLTCTVNTADMYIKKADSTQNLWVTWSVSGLPEGAVMTWKYGQEPNGYDWIEDTGVLALDVAIEKIFRGVISGIGESSTSGIIISFEAHDVIPP